ncbi:MAG TPA: lytic transglycosylase domain-containing protein [Syntrophomonadaceae bacterium]|nr:lytic transglycosylase domain-containing protein [Syntrophomonadaceae bacterium]
MSNPMLDLLKDMQLFNMLNNFIRRNAPNAIKSIPNQQPVNSSSSRPFSEIIQEASRKYGVDEGIITAVIKHESSFNPRAQSPCGAQGLMQLMPATARSLGVTNAFDPEQNIMAGTKYLRQQLDTFNGDLRLALAAYNAGGGAVKKYGGIPPYAETQNYVKNVMHSINTLA